MENRNAVYRGMVVDSLDPLNAGRVRVSVPVFDEELWARLVTLSAGAGYGSWFVPEAGTEVLVAFESGEPTQPYVIGSLWGQSQPPPETDPGRTVLQTRHGATVVFDDGAGAIEIELPSGTAVRLTPGGAAVSGPGTVTIQAGEIVIAGTTVQVNAEVSRFGVVECTLLRAGTVVAQTYGGNGP